MRKTIFKRFAMVAFGLTFLISCQQDDLHNIPVDIVHDLIDKNADVVRVGFTDNVNGYTVKQIFGALRPGVETVQGFRNRLLQNNENHQQQAVNDLFNAYFYN